MSDMVGVEVDKIDDAVIRVKTLTVVEGVMDMTFWEVLAAGITETVVDN